MCNDIKTLDGNMRKDTFLANWLVIKSMFSNAYKSGYLAARELAEVRFEVLSDHCVNGHQAEHASFPHTALRVVITLFNQIKYITNLQDNLFKTKESEKVFMRVVWMCVGIVLDCDFQHQN